MILITCIIIKSRIYSYHIEIMSKSFSATDASSFAKTVHRRISPEAARDATSVDQALGRRDQTSISLCTNEVFVQRDADVFSSSDYSATGQQNNQSFVGHEYIGYASKIDKIDLVDSASLNDSNNENLAAHSAYDGPLKSVSSDNGAIDYSIHTATKTNAEAIYDPSDIINRAGMKAEKGSNEMKFAADSKSISKPCRPNYFIGFRLTHPRFMEIVDGIHNSIRISHPHLSKCITPSNKLHITGIVMELESEEQIATAVSRLQSCASMIDDIIRPIGEVTLNSRKFSLPMGKIEAFGSRVLYIDPIPSIEMDALRQIQQIIYDSFQSHEPKFRLDCTNESWIPHATIMKTSADKKNGRRLKIPKDDFTIYECRLDLRVPFLSIDLLSMQEKDATGYYKSYSSIAFEYDT